MARTGPFQQYTVQYDEWFDENRLVYEAELKAVGSQLPQAGRGLEIGAGTGRFAVPLGVEVGIEPARSMRESARKRGLKVAGGIAEQLPLRDGAFGYALMVTVICFVDDLHAAFREAFRVLSPGGFLIVGFVDRDSPLGRAYQRHAHESVFYREATFFAVGEVADAMRSTGFHDFSFRQTIFHELPGVTGNEPVEPGYGDGSFVVVRGRRR